jgi:hypothetical protein
MALTEFHFVLVRRCCAALVCRDDHSTIFDDAAQVDADRVRCVHKLTEQIVFEHVIDTKV